MINRRVFHIIKIQPMKDSICIIKFILFTLILEKTTQKQLSDNPKTTQNATKVANEKVCIFFQTFLGTSNYFS